MHICSALNCLKAQLTTFLLPRNLAIVAALIGLAGVASAQDDLRPNARVSGDFQSLDAFSRGIHTRTCTTSRCEYLGNWRVQASFPGRVSGRVVFSKARFPRQIERFSNGAEENDLSTRPVFLRGTALLRHGRETAKRTLRVAGAVLRDRGTYVLQLTLPSDRIKGLLPSRPIVFRVPLKAATNGARLNARAEHASSYAYQDLTCGEDRLTLSSVSSAATAWSAPAVQPATYSVIYVGTDFDTQYQTKLGCSTTSCKNLIATTVDQAAVYYENQFGYTLEVAKQYGPNKSLGTSTDSAAALSTFRSYNNTNRLTAPVDFFQLYTGRSMQNGVIGLAYVGVTCQYKDYSSLLIQHVSSVVNPVTAAHESGHTLNASHSTSGIMSATLSFPLPTSFSSDSVAQISSYLSAQYGGCIGGTSSSNPTPTPVPTSTPTATPTTPGGGGGGGGGGTGPTPTPTPTHTPGGGTGGGGGGNAGGPPVTLGLGVKENTAGDITITVKVTEIVDGCSVQLRAGSSISGAYNGTMIASFEPGDLSTTLTANIPYLVKPSRSAGATVFFGASYVCSDGTEQEVSLIKRLNANKVRRSKGVLSKTAWIRRLDAQL
jgi:hypothetical protein